MTAKDVALSLREENAQIIKFKADGFSLGVERLQWQTSLSQAKPDRAVNIRHGEISGDGSYRTHVAAIPAQVSCHFHTEGDEDYAIVEGEGILFFGKTTNGKVNSQDWKSITVRAGDSFVIPEGYAHQLCKTGAKELTIVFGCPDSHLNYDRYLLPDAPR
ncbi:MAG: cupin domain-containing protein [Phormidesmis sp.]